MLTRVKLTLLVGLLFFGFIGWCPADTLVMNDGTKINGSVMKAGDRFWIEPDDGAKAHYVDSSDVKDWIKGTPAAAPSSTADTSSPTSAAPVQRLSGAYGAAKAKADGLIYPADQMKIWNDFLASKPTPSDFDKQSANIELANLKKLDESGSEKLGGKWISGIERKKLLADSQVVFKEAMDLLKAKKTLQVVPKLQEVLKIYPNHYYANTYLAYIMDAANNETESMKYVQMCLKLRPTSVDALNNYGVLLAEKKQYEQAVAIFYQAAMIQDQEDLATNLYKALLSCPNKNSQAVMKATEASKILASKYSIPPNLTPREWAQVPFTMIPPVESETPGQGMLVGGSGFVLNEEGYILTNRHVVLNMTSFLVITADGTHMAAELVKADKDRDLALLKIKKIDPAAHLVAVTISKNDYPAEGQQCYAVGYPLMDVLGATIKVTQGIISGKAKAENGVDVLLDAKVNPGNSGGPLLDKFGQVIGIVTMKTLSDTEEDSYGMAISSGTLKKFLSENNITFAQVEGGAALDSEDVVKKVRAGTVCILAH